MAHPKLARVRQEYQFRCGYCGVAEEDAGGELTIDHFLPTSAGGDNNDENLVYACFRCNIHKSDVLPGAIGEARRLLHPKRDDFAAHIQMKAATGRLIGLTETGLFHISTLRLNRPALIAYRKNQMLKILDAQTLEQTVAENAILRDGLAALKLYVANLQEQTEEQNPPEA